MLLAVCWLVHSGYGVDRAYALHPQYEASFNRALIDIHYEHPDYISPELRRKDGSIGARLSEPDEIDCSLLFGRGAQRAVIPGISTYRPTVSSIYQQQGGWKHRVADVDDARPGDLIIQHIPPKKGGLKKRASPGDPYAVNHILGIVEHNGVMKVIHASSSAKTVVIIPFQDWISRYMVPGGYRRLIAGE